MNDPQHKAHTMYFRTMGRTQDGKRYGIYWFDGETEHDHARTTTRERATAACEAFRIDFREVSTTDHATKVEEQS